MINQQPGTPYSPNADLVLIELATAPNPAIHNCSPATTEAKGFFLNVNTDKAKRLFNTLLAAYIAGKPVRIYTTGTCSPVWGYGEIDGVVVDPN